MRIEKESNPIRGEYEMVIPAEVEPEIGSVLTELDKLGARGMLVGGCVRDMVFGKVYGKEVKPKDFDIEVYGLTDIELISFLVNYFGDKRVDLVGKAFGVIKVKIDGWDEPIDFSMPRRDSKVGNGHKGFIANGDPFMTLLEAARRRDITANSMAYDPLSGTLYDPFKGVEDIKEGIIRVTDKETFVEDPLRVYRVMQFAGRFGFKADQATIELCKEIIQKEEFKNLPKERYTEEFAKMFLKGGRPSLGFEFAREIGLVAQAWPELFDLVGLLQEPEWHPEGDVWTHTMQVVDAMSLIIAQLKRDEQMPKCSALVLMLSAVCHDLGKKEKTVLNDGKIASPGHEVAGEGPTRSFLERFSPTQVNSKVVEEVVSLVKTHMRPHPIWETHRDSTSRRAVNRLCRELEMAGCDIYSLLCLVTADKSGRNPSGFPYSLDEMFDRKEMEFGEWWVKLPDLHAEKKLILGGKRIMDVLALCQLPKSPGPHIGYIQKAHYDYLPHEVTDDQIIGAFREWEMATLSLGR